MSQSESKTAAFEELLAKLVGPSNVATVTSATLERSGHDLARIVADADAYRRLSPKGRRYHVEIILPEPDSKEFGLSIKRI